MSKDEGKQKARPRNEAKSLAKIRRTAARKAKNVAKYEARQAANLDLIAAHRLTPINLVRYRKQPVMVPKGSGVGTYPSLYTKPLSQPAGVRRESPSETVARARREGVLK